jgi:leucyl/phenylalanyl-tRNA--protein transferase
MSKIIPPEILLEAYAQGVFPMAEDGEILWFSPERRGLIPLDEDFHIPHGLAKSLKRQPFEIRWNTAFREVMLGCASREETWIDEVILDSYCTLHAAGHAHSVECWDAEGLQGGLYGVALPGVFFGESMFSRKTDASKIALVALVGRLRDTGFSLLDTQWMTPHLRQFGGYELRRRDYLAALQTALQVDGRGHCWKMPK